MDEITKQQIKEAVIEAFSAGVDNGRYIDITRIPLICQSIVGIDNKLTDLSKTIDEKLVTQDQFWPVKALVFGTVGLLGTGVVGGFIMLLLNK